MEYKSQIENKVYQGLNLEKTYHFEIEKIDKEAKPIGKAVPFIRLFCKSSGKCGV